LTTSDLPAPLALRQNLDSDPAGAPPRRAADNQDIA
jgi:hypothetical protein